MPKRGTLGHDMMFRSCTIQVQRLGTFTCEVFRFASGCMVMCNTSTIRAEAQKQFGFPGVSANV